jgi:hypothetical protein
MPALPVIGVQSGRTSAPIRPHAVQTIRWARSSGTLSSGNPVSVELGAVIAPNRVAVDQQIAAAMATDVAHGDGCERLARAGHTVNSIFTAQGVEIDQNVNRS